MKKLFLFFIVAGALGAGVWWWRFAPRTQGLSEEQLTFTTLTRATIRDVVGATGLVEPREVVLVGSEMPGIVTQVHGKINQQVSEGMVLAQLDDRKLRFQAEKASNGALAAKAALAQAQAARDAAEIAYKTQVELESKGGIRADKEQAHFQLKAAEAGVLAAQGTLSAANTAHREAQLALEMTEIKVPTLSTNGASVNGGHANGGKRSFLVLDRKVHEGQMVGPQAPPLFMLAGDLERVEVHAQIAEGDVNKVRKGHDAAFKITTFADEEVEFRGKVKEIRPLATNIKGSVYYATVIDVANQRDPQSGEWRLRPGMTVSVDVIRREHNEAWCVPSAAMNFLLDAAYRSAAAQNRLEAWRARPDAVDWHTLWIWDKEQQAPAPLFVRVGGLKNGMPGLKDEDGNEILEWEPGREPSPGEPAPRIIIQTPPARQPGFFDRPANIKVS